MKRKLEELFLFQKFVNDKELNKIINSVLNVGEELTDEDLDMVFAAGEPIINNKKPQKKRNKQGENL